MIKVSIIGLGNIGTSIASLLVNDFRHKFEINLCYKSRGVKGRFLDLNHASAISKRHNIFLNSHEKFVQSNYIFHCAGAAIPPGLPRTYVAEKSRIITSEIFEDVKFLNDPRVIVITNPVELICGFLSQISNISRENILGTGTYLDKLRFDYYLSESFKIPLNQIDSLVIGEHGETMVAVPEMTKIKNNILSDFPINEWQEAWEKTVKSAQLIKRNENATIYGVSHAAVNLLMEWIMPVGNRVLASIQPNPFYQQWIHENIFIGLPVKFSKYGVRAVSGNYSQNTINALINSAKHIARHQ